MKFLELPIAYQKGCHFIQEKCQYLFSKTTLHFDELYWGKLTLSACHLFIIVENKIYHIKFGKIALIHFEEPGMVESIICKLSFLLNQIKSAANN